MFQSRKRSEAVAARSAWLPHLVELSLDQLLAVHGGAPFVQGNSTSMLIINVTMTVKKPVLVSPQP